MRRALFYASISCWKIWKGPIGSIRWKIGAFFLSKACNRAFKSWQDWGNPDDNYEQMGWPKDEPKRGDRLH